MHRNHNIGPNILNELHGRFPIESDLKRTVRPGRNNCPKVEDRERNMKLFSHLCEFFEVDRISREVDCIRESFRTGPKRCSLHDEPSGFATWKMYTGSTGDIEFLSSNLERQGFPGTNGMDSGPWLKLASAVGSGDDRPSVEERTSSSIEVVWMIFMAQQHCVDGGQLIKTKGSCLQTLKCDHSQVVGCPNGVKDRVGDKVDSVNSENSGSGADEGHLDLALEPRWSHWERRVDGQRDGMRS
ncbi:hypothetical protein RSOL_269480 [Rhizoctonia solani AG-3 Rhs1AP]|uniref:Uncharacterized protein n=2 Tax=Rhizoctonia solani AG-3 TaxID=1086053 RepID=A0A074RPZ4_9AGAM|nr:hypothetical protein RSOL_269480 [Rhizoctonia solani AG-3 Rhs1AP]KEP46723.1 hypothetical protein V565_184370 [Rhizoctonia solani 123E]